jgi:hypothetical protein
MYAVVILNQPAATMKIDRTPVATLGSPVSGTLPSFSGTVNATPYAIYRVSTTAGANLGRSTLTGCDAYFCSGFPGYADRNIIFTVQSGGMGLTYSIPIYRMQNGTFQYPPISITSSMYILLVFGSTASPISYQLTPRRLPSVTVDPTAATLTITNDFFLTVSGPNATTTGFTVDSGASPTVDTLQYGFNLDNAKSDVISWFGSKIGSVYNAYAVNATFASYTDDQGRISTNYACVVRLSIGDHSSIGGGGIVPLADVLMCPIGNIADVATSGTMSAALIGTFALPVTFSEHISQTQIGTNQEWY